MISVFTAAYNSGDKIERCYRSLMAQDHRDWEWAVADDSDNPESQARITSLAERDPRIHVVQMPAHSGVIGAVKRRACLLSTGAILLELDHDDELVPQALSAVAQAFADNPEAGFVHSDWAEQFADGTPATYGPAWAYWAGGQRFAGELAYRWEAHEGRQLLVHAAPALDAATIRHIVAAPNHVRAWRREAYWRVGGHDPTLDVADDYDLVVRTWLATRCLHIPRCLYIQWYNGLPPHKRGPGDTDGGNTQRGPGDTDGGTDGGNTDGGNTQRVRNARIQALVAELSQKYDTAIHQRLLALGLPDFVWDARPAMTREETHA